MWRALFQRGPPAFAGSDPTARHGPTVSAGGPRWLARPLWGRPTARRFRADISDVTTPLGAKTTDGPLRALRLAPIQGVQFDFVAVGLFPLFRGFSGDDGQVVHGRSLALSRRLSGRDSNPRHGVLPRACHVRFPRIRGLITFCPYFTRPCRGCSPGSDRPLAWAWLGDRSALSGEKSGVRGTLLRGLRGPRPRPRRPPRRCHRRHRP